MAENQLRCPCNQCHIDTLHEALHVKSHQEDYPVGGSDEYSVTWLEKWTLLQCRGCQSITAHRRCYFSEWEPGVVEDHYYPPRISRRLPAWQSDLPSEIASLMEEVYAALHSGSRRLAMMGGRALLDMMIVEKVGDVGTFEQKLRKLEESGFIGSVSRSVLDAALDAGNAASHRGFSPTASTANQVMDIIENVLQSAYLQHSADEVRRSTPQRIRPNGSSAAGGGN